MLPGHWAVVDMDAILKNEDAISTYDSDSEMEDCVIQDEVRSDVEDEMVEYEESTTHEISPMESQSTSNAKNLEITQSRSRKTIILPKSSIHGENKLVRSQTKSQPSARTSMDKLHEKEGPTRRNVDDPKDCFQLFITNEIIEEIVKWTNTEVTRKRQNIKEITANYRFTSKEEIWALIGMLTLTAVLKDNHITTEELFDASFSGTRYVAVMSMERFNFLMRCLRMAEKTESEDAFNPIRKVWELFISQCRSNYVPGMNLTVDDQSLSFRGKCPFRVYIPNKGKYGIKFPTICDASTKYMVDAVPYLGKSTVTDDQPLGEYYVKELTKTLCGTNRNVTCGNWVTSVPLAKSLLKNPYNLTVVGSIRSNMKYFPEELKNSRSLPVGSSVFCFDGPLTLVSYKPKPSKMLYLLSSREEDASVKEDDEKPNMLMFYEETKGGVNYFSEMCSSMSCCRKTRRWPTAVFFGMLNMAFANSYIIYCLNMLTNEKNPLNRISFMKKLSHDLTSTWMDIRLETPTLNRAIRENICGILQKTPQTSAEMFSDEPEMKKRRTCGVCSYKKRRMTKSQCLICKKPVCGEHFVRVCRNCMKDQKLQ